jgi:hypothetical protein
LFGVAECHRYGRGVPENKAEAMHWYRRAHAVRPRCVESSPSRKITGKQRIGWRGR